MGLDIKMEENMSFAIPTINFKRLIEQDISDKFKLIIEYGEIQTEIYITSNIARLISRKINDIHHIDPTISEYHIKYSKELLELNKSINNDDKKEEKEEIEEIKEMINSLIRSTKEEITIQPKNQKKFEFLLFLLGENKKDKNFFIIESDTEAISLLNTELHDIAIEYLSKHLISIIDNDKMIKFNSKIMREIIDKYFDEKNKTENEESIDEINELFNKMKTKEEKEIVMHFLLCHEFEKYNQEMIDFFYQNIDDDIIENDYSRIIYIIRHHLCSLVPKKCETKNDKMTECQFKGDELDGIFNHLRQKLGDELYNNQMIKFSAGGFLHKSCPITNLFKYDKENIDKTFYNYSGAFPKSESDSWIEIDLGERKINLTSYTIRTCDHTAINGCKAKSWRIVGSNDHEHWDVLSHQINRTELQEPKSQHRFECESNSQFYKYIRYIQEETSSDNSTYKYKIHYACIEFFGTILDP